MLPNCIYCRMPFMAPFLLISFLTLPCQHLNSQLAGRFSPSKSMASGYCGVRYCPVFSFIKWFILVLIGTLPQISVYSPWLCINSEVSQKSLHCSLRTSWVWWYTPAVPALCKLRQQDHRFEHSVGNFVTWYPVSKFKKGCGITQCEGCCFNPKFLGAREEILMLQNKASS